ncbi:type VII secretion-associated protein [Mycobacterium sp. SA01]|uniref:type VII secretion-associated protein n=1 Tax=Mycobacterium sp. SA01 TaxID=3238820 RepID=UPI00351B7A6F
MTVLEVGPAVVTRLTPHPQRTGDPEMVTAALAGIDDTVVLFRERPVAVADLWRTIFADCVEERCETLTVVHPSWWTPHRVSRLVDAAAAVATEVLAQPRSAVLAETIEEPTPATAAPGPVPRRPWRAAAAVAAGVALTLCVVGVAAVGTPAVPTPRGIYIVEGRVTVRIPPDWVITRVTAGPGSRRVQASSPTDSNTALHVTQSYSPEETLDQTAATLRQAIDEQPRGVFVDFNPADRRGGRPAVTYREVRIAREIRWAVVLDGSTRISIGCESAQGRPDSIAEPCDEAVESAHEFGGTADGS